MRASRIGAAALVAAAMVCACPANRSEAQDAADASERLLLFSGAEIARASRFLHGGFLWSPGGIKAEGLAIKTLAGAGMYRYRSGAQEITGDRARLHLAGLALQQETFETTLFAGPQALGDGSYRELRVGLHATAWRTGPFEWSAGLGYARSGTSAGARARAGLLTRQ